MSSFLILVALFLLNNALSRQLLATTDNTYEYDLMFTLYFIWNKTNTTISYNSIYASITTIIENTDHTLQSLSDTSINQNNLIYWNKSESRIITINMITKHSNLKIYKNLFSINTKQSINFMTNIINIKNVIVSLHLIETPPKTNLSLILGITITSFLCIICCGYCIYNQHKYGAVRKVRMEFGKTNEEWIYNNGEKLTDINNTNPFSDGKYWGYYEHTSRNNSNKSEYENTNSEHTMLDIDLKFIDNQKESYPIVTGKGTDVNGKYVIEGIYCIDSKRMTLQQIYNEDNIVQVRLKWNINQNQFKGTWYTNKNKQEQFGCWIISKCDDIIMDVIKDKNIAVDEIDVNIDHENENENDNHLRMHIPVSSNMTSSHTQTSTTIVYDNNSKNNYNMVSGMSFSSTVSGKDKNNKPYMGFMFPQASIDSFKTASGGTSTATPSEIIITNNMNKKKSYESICGIKVDESLPHGWREDITTDGRVYWQKEGTNEILYQKPTHNMVRDMNKQKSKHKHDGSTNF